MSQAKEAENTLSVHKEGMKYTLTATTKKEYTAKEYLELLGNLRNELNKFKKQRENLSKAEEEVKGQIQKLEKNLGNIEEVLEAGVRQKIEDLKKTKEYEEFAGDKRAWLFSRKELMDYAPNEILQKVLWEKEIREAKLKEIMGDKV